MATISIDGSDLTIDVHGMDKFWDRLGDRDDVTVHSTRIPVTRIALDQGSDKQFDVVGMRTAAQLLATARPRAAPVPPGNDGRQNT